jgi:hypothetical protein
MAMLAIMFFFEFVRKTGIASTSASMAARMTPEPTMGNMEANFRSWNIWFSM